MKSLILQLLALLSVSSAWAEETTDSPLTRMSETTLNAAAYYIDSIFVNALDSLELVASTPEATSGNWNGIKPYLEKLESHLPGVYFFVLPNGNYYSVSLDYTSLNLSDRPYFPSLFAGRPVMGFPIYSRSTGRKSALVAAPIVVDNEVTGALGTSIFLDNLNKKLSQALVLPEEYSWYVIDSEGNTMLHRDSGLIFMNALFQGSKTLREVAIKALKNESGSTAYELDTKRLAQYRKLPTMDWWMFIAKIRSTKRQAPPQLKLSLERFVPDLQHALNRIDGSAAKLISESHIDAEEETDIRNLLRSILEENTYIVEAAFVDYNGTLRYIEPSDYKNFEDVDISAQEHIVAMREQPHPQFTKGFMAVEGFLAVLIARPLRSAEGKLIGQINLVIRPELLIDALLHKTTIPEDYELWIMQTDGTIIYDQNKEEIGKRLFGDPLYADYGNLLELGKKIASSPTGEGTYIFLSPDSNEKVIKQALWETIRLHNNEWRVVLAFRPYQ